MWQSVFVQLYKCDIARRQPVCYIWRGICSSWRIPQTRGAMRHITRGSAMPAILCSKICIGERNRKINAHRHYTKNIFLYCANANNSFTYPCSLLRVLWYVTKVQIVIITHLRYNKSHSVKVIWRILASSTRVWVITFLKHLPRDTTLLSARQNRILKTYTARYNTLWGHPRCGGETSYFHDFCFLRL